MYPPALSRALNTFGRGLHGKRRETLEVIEAHLKLYHDGLMDLLGPGHVPPETAVTKALNIAKPAITASYWTDGPWHCLRIDERTIGHNRPRAWFNKAAGYPQLRQDAATEQWMGWVEKILAHFNVRPLEGSVRVVFFPGLVYTFTAWRKVDDRQVSLLHPMDPDNSAKALLDAAMVPKPAKESETPSKKKHKPKPLTGAYYDDAQIVDLLVFRLPQEGKPAVDRITLHKERSAIRKTVLAKRRAKEAMEMEAQGESEEPANQEQN